MQNILELDLSSGQSRLLEVPRQWEVDFLGGASLGARLLYSELTAGLDPFSESAPLLFIGGPLSGTAGPAVGRFVACGKSPATSLWGESNFGGFWGAELRKAGFDGLLLRGKAAAPVYLVIDDSKVYIRDAKRLWGKETYRAQQMVVEELGERGFRVAVIGPAGENRVPYSLILTDHGRVAGRTGMGAVMGSKNLKAIAVRGSRSIPVAQPEQYHALRAEANRNLRNENQSVVLRELGTAGGAEYFDYLGLMPKRYYRQSRFEGVEKVSGAYFAENLLKGVSACHACVIACGRVVQYEDSPKKKGPEYETIVGFGPNLLISDPIAITELGELCDRLGLDTISTSNTIGLAFSLYEKGLIPISDTDGLELQWGDAHAVRKLIPRIAEREGFGALLALGSKGLAEHYGVAEEAVQVNGLEVAYHDPRGASGMALVYATSPIGASHNQSDYFFVEIGQVESSIGLEPHSRLGGAEKAKNVSLHQDWRTVFNSLVMCIFTNIPPESIVALVNAACGLDLDVGALMRSGERGWNLKRAINVRLGLSPENERMPKAFRQPYEDGQGELESYVVPFEEMRQAYYCVRGWDLTSGKPSREKLRELNLGWLIPDLWSEEGV
ncbi:MAG: aldehyde ferredoxin oxidoreductase family protein [Anaerolineales bacterium]|nr:aldehyde ferredoxin oxidoreductase family protein [Anaerolineales bacterium]MDW8160976.1 aldehyde ferredoxin oxidoreductase family protein [Anaerolineales bacterium]